MSMNYDPNSTDKPTGDLEPGESMFAGVPAWERSSKKRRGFGGSRATTAATTPVVETTRVEPVTSAPLTRETPAFDRVDRTEYATMGTAGALGASTIVADEPLMAPPPRTTTIRKSSGVSPMALAAGIIVLGGIAGAGWYASQPRDTGVAELAPGEPAGMTTTTTTTAPTQLAANTPPPAVTRTETTRSVSSPTVSSRTTTSRTTTVRTRPAASSSAMDMGVNTSATLPAGPQPYSGAATTRTPAFNYTGPVNPTPTPAAPAAVNPDPTPVEPSASSSASSPTPDTTATPPVTSPPQ